MSAKDGSATAGRIARGYAEGPFGQIHYATRGAGKPLLLLHQTPRSWDEYAQIMQLLPPSRQMIAMDLPGMGASDPPPGAPSIEAFSDAAAALLDRLCSRSADVFGHHTGAFVAAALAARHPERVSSVMLSAPGWVDEEMRAAPPDPRELPVDNADPVESGEHLVELWRQRQPSYPAGRVDLLSAYMRDALRVADPRAGHVACSRYSMARAAAQIRCPAMLIGHDADPHSIEDLPQLAMRMPEAKVEVVEGGMVPLEMHAERVASLIDGFLSR